MNPNTLIKFLKEQGVKYRIIREDDKFCFVTDDTQPERWNLEIDNGLITKITFG